MNLARSHVDTLRQQEVSRSEGDRILLVDQILRVARGGGADKSDGGRRSRESVNACQSVAGGVHRRRNSQRHSRARSNAIIGGHHKLLQTAGRLAGLRVDAVDTRNSKHIAPQNGFGAAREADVQRRLTLRGNGSCNDRCGGEVTSGVVPNRLRHVDFVVAQNASAHHACRELASDGAGWVEEALHAFDQVRIGGRVHRRVAIVHRRSVLVQLLVALQQDQRGGRRGARRTNSREDRLVCGGDIGIDAGGQLRNTGFENPFREVVQLHGQFSRGEVDTDVLLACDRQRGELLVVVLDLQGGAIGHQSTVGQTNAQGGADLRTFNGERVVVLAVDVAGEHQVVLENFESLPSDHVNGKNAV